MTKNLHAMCRFFAILCDLCWSVPEFIIAEGIVTKSDMLCFAPM